jgi:SHS2 domain-containing protein
MSSFEEIDHTSDRAFRVRAPTCEALFLRAAEALYQIGGVETDPAQSAERFIDLQAEDTESLLVAWLNEILFLLENERLALRDLRCETFSGRHIRAGGNPARVRAAGKYIKAATFSGLRIVQSENGCEATIVVDV